VQAASNLQAELVYTSADRGGALQRCRGTVEHSQESVPDRLDLVASETNELAPYEPVMIVEKVTPRPVAESNDVFCGSDDVREQHGCDGPTGNARSARAGEELLDFVHDELAVPGPPEVILTGQLDVLRGRDVACEIPTVLRRDHPVAAAVDH
jgi:hypothetical protein